MLSLLLTTLLPALLPVGIDAAKGLVNKALDNANAAPSNFGEFMQLQQFQLDRLKALAQLDMPNGQISMWVADLRASFRYIAAAIIILTYVAVTVGNLPMGTEQYEQLRELTGATFFFLFGDRIYMGLKSRS